MSVERAKKYLSQFHMEHKIITFATSSATVELAAIAAGTESSRAAISPGTVAVSVVLRTRLPR